MDSDKDVVRCSEAVVNHYGVTFACLGASLEKLNMKQEALSGAMQREGERLIEEPSRQRLLSAFRLEIFQADIVK